MNPTNEKKQPESILTSAASRKRKLAASNDDGSRKTVRFDDEVGLPRFSETGNDIENGKPKGVDMSFIKKAIDQEKKSAVKSKQNSTYKTSTTSVESTDIVESSSSQDSQTELFTDCFA